MPPAYAEPVPEADQRCRSSHILLHAQGLAVYSQVWPGSPVLCGRAGCKDSVSDWRQAIFVVSQGVGLPFCSNECFATPCHRQVQEHRARQDPLERLGYISREAE